MRTRIITIAVLVLLAILVNSVPSENSTSGITQFLHNVGESQEDLSNDLTNMAVSEVEGSVVGEHKVNGSNWSIPNILRHLVGGD